MSAAAPSSASPDSPAWHSLPGEACLERLGTGPDGLSEAEAAARRLTHGPNELREDSRQPAWKIFVAQFTSLLVLILVGAAVASLALGKSVEASAILVIVLLAGILGFLQEHQAGKAIEALKRMAAPTATVLRGGFETVIPSADLVPGDVVVLKAGDRVPADLRLLQTASLRIDEAALTGESLPVEKSCAVVPGESPPLGDRINLAYMGTNAVYGRATGLVVGIGMGTEFGRIAAGLSSTEREATPLQRNLDDLGKRLGLVAIAIAASMSVVELFRGAPWADIFVWGIALAVAVIPEALPAVVTITLALGVRRMVRRRALIRKLPAVETLGATSVICSDKTGTLTQDEMTVRRIVTGDAGFDVDGVGYAPEGGFRSEGRPVDPATAPDLLRFLTLGVLCNDSRLVHAEAGWSIVGDPTEGALVVAAAKAGLKKEPVDQAHPRLHEIPFSSESKRMTTVHAEHGAPLAVCKGAPEVILASCTTVWRDGRAEPMTAELRETLGRRAHALADDALRVLGLAFRTLPAGTEPHLHAPDTLEQDLTFLGFAGMMDPPRPEAREAIRTCGLAGIRAVMITGDHKSTAVAVARELGILEAGGQALSGAELDRLSAPEFHAAMRSVRVCARISPSHKLRIVEALMEQGHVVAMTGDGVNDAPALKRANIGVAMGVTGTEVSKEAADMVLTDDNFASIVSAVEEGRSIFENIRKYLHYLLSGNMGTVFGMLFALLLNLPVPLTAVQILFVNFLMDGIIAIALGVEPPERGIMRRPPRDVKRGILGRRDVESILGVGLWIAVANTAWFAWALHLGRPTEEAMTLFFVGLLLARMANSFNSRSLTDPLFTLAPFGNPALLGALGLVAAAVLAVLYVPALQLVFKTHALRPGEWLAAFLLALSVLVYGEVHKFVARPRSPGKRSEEPLPTRD